MQITTFGLDIAKNVFQVHGIDGDEKVVVRKSNCGAAYPVAIEVKQTYTGRS